MFVNSGTYYDALYAEKNYKAEFKFLCEHIDFSLIGNIIEIGSGTGAFTILLAEQLMKNRFMGEVNLSNSTTVEYYNQSPNILCIEPSASMIEISKKKLFACPVSYLESSAAFLLTRKARSILENSQLTISMFHVMSYLKWSDLRKILLTMAKSHQVGAYVCFDFWDLSSVINNPPSITCKEVMFNGNTIRRIATPSEVKELRTDLSISYDVKFSFQEMLLQSSVPRTFDSFTENHRMTAFSGDDIILLLRESMELVADLDVVSQSKWMSRHYGRTLIFRKY
jgi:hypothetical protein